MTVEKEIERLERVESGSARAWDHVVAILTNLDLRLTNMEREVREDKMNEKVSKTAKTVKTEMRSPNGEGKKC